MINKIQTLEEFYSERSLRKSDDLVSGIDYLNVFRIEENNANQLAPVPFNRKNFYKICLTKGKSKIHYAERSFEIKHYALLFANPLVPYKWESLESEQKGFSCIFSEDFFANYGNLKEYPVFKPEGFPVYELNSKEVSTISSIFKQMIEELDSNFEYKSEVLKNLVFQLIHCTLKEKQFPIIGNDDRIQLRSPSDFANQLSVHVNHLNKSVKDVTKRTTTELIMQRLIKEAKILLKHSAWNISEIAEIAYTLGFESPTHFNTFFKKYVSLTPSQFRSN